MNLRATLRRFLRPRDIGDPEPIFILFRANRRKVRVCSVNSAKKRGRWLRTRRNRNRRLVPNRTVHPNHARKRRILRERKRRLSASPSRGASSTSSPCGAMCRPSSFSTNLSSQEIDGGLRRRGGASLRGRRSSRRWPTNAGCWSADPWWRSGECTAPSAAVRMEWSRLPTPVAWARGP